MATCSIVAVVLGLAITGYGASVTATMASRAATGHGVTSTIASTASTARPHHNNFRKTWTS